MPGFQSTRLVTEGALEPFFFLYTDDSIQGNPETCKQSNVMLNYEVKNTYEQIYQKIWGNYVQDIENNTIGSHVCKLREKLYKACPDRKFEIRCVREIGYCFEAK